MSDLHLADWSTANIDPNALLSELDRGLRSANSGDQCEAIVRFPWLFHRYPFPILINSASLKLAELFRNGPNFARVLILKVMQQTDRHMDKILNVDEFVRRIFSVTYSNDPVARSLTLRVLGAVSVITSEREIIQHCVRSSLDSKEAIELTAAVEAAGCFARTSAKFANNINGKIIGMIESHENSEETKMNLLSVFSHGNYTAASANRVRTHLLALLDKTKSAKLKMTLINSLTDVSAASPFLAHSQMELLVKLFSESEDPMMTRCVMRNLHNLVSKRPHLWSDASFPQLISAVKNSTEHTQLAIYLILSRIVSSSAVSFQDISRREMMIDEILSQTINTLYTSTDANLLAAAVELLTALGRRYRDEKPNLPVEVTVALQAIISTFHHNIEHGSKKRPETKRLFRSVSLFAKEFPSSVPNLLVTLKNVILAIDIDGNDSMDDAMETLASVASASQTKEFPLSDEELIDLIQKFANAKSENCLVFAITAYLVYCYMTPEENRSPIKETFVSARLERRSLWCLYRVIRQAMRFGLFSLAHHLSQIMFESANNENEYFWSMALLKISESETEISQWSSTATGGLAIQKSISLLYQVMTALKSTKPSENGPFRLEFIRLRIKYLECHLSLDSCCKLSRLCPCPSSASTLALYSRDEMMRAGALVAEMRKCYADFYMVADAYAKLYEMSFNADDATLLHLRLMQQICMTLAQVLELYFKPNAMSLQKTDQQLMSGSSSSFFQAILFPKEIPIEQRKLVQVCRGLSAFGSYRPTHLTTVEDYVEQCLSSVTEMQRCLLATSLPIPRYVFQYDAHTCVKLAVSPQNKTPNELLIVNHSTLFVLKVEGVVTDSTSELGGRKSRLRSRSLSKVSLSASIQQTYKPISADMVPLCKATDGCKTLSASVEPHNDYFQHQFLLTFPSAGIYTVTVDTCLVDEASIMWRTGPSVSVHVKVSDDTFKH